MFGRKIFWLLVWASSTIAATNIELAASVDANPAAVVRPVLDVEGGTLRLADFVVSTNNPATIRAQDNPQLSNGLNVSPYGTPPVYIADLPKAPVSVRPLNNTVNDLSSMPSMASEVDTSGVDSLMVEARLDVNLWVMQELNLRACLRLQLSAPDPVRGTVIRTDNARVSCFSGARAFNFTLPPLVVGKHSVSVSLVDSGNIPVGPPSQQVPIIVVPTFNFQPLYDWQFVHDWQSVPTGMEVKLPIDGSGERLARIPDPWRLQVYLGDGEGFFRGNVRRHWTMNRIRDAISSDIKVPNGCVNLWFDRDGTDDRAANSTVMDRPRVTLHSTVQSLHLFQQHSRLQASITRRSSPDCMCAGAMPCAYAKRWRSTACRANREKTIQSTCTASITALKTCNTVCGVKSDAEVAEEKRLKRAEEKAEKEAKKLAAQQSVQDEKSSANDEHWTQDANDETEEAQVPRAPSRVSGDAYTIHEPGNDKDALLAALANANHNTVLTKPANDVDETEWANVLAKHELERLTNLKVLDTNVRIVDTSLDTERAHRATREEVDSAMESLFVDIGDEDVEDNDDVLDLSGFVL